MEKIPLIGMTLDDLHKVTNSLGMPAFTSKQIAQWIYQKRAVSIDDFSNLSLKNRELLKENYTVGLSRPINAVTSSDGTSKFLINVDVDGIGAASDHTPHNVETVFIPDGNRATLCVSTQVGCKMGCKFCFTGAQHFTASLKSAHIMNQILVVPGSVELTNLVFMGMGEPLDNLEQVLKTIEILTSPWGLAWSPKRITVSTVGLRRELKQLIEGCDCHIAVSLHASNPQLRESLVPAEKAFSMTEMLEVLRRYDFSHQRRLSFEYTMFQGVNDSLANAAELVKTLEGLSCRVNLIRYHAIPDVPFKPSPEAQMIAFRDYLTGHGVFSTIRASRGEDVWAACGMLSSKNKIE
ncbi:MAG: 23S rRNA (adenine(2503)-C(2))-methyltransferase RlmN [Bacteroidaceae bacterium]|nr:23S rRNA (adenine(2503)-C(2))-methyltransferase RlmN [Bacteroidaceae bacterium]